MMRCPQNETRQLIANVAELLRLPLDDHTRAAAADAFLCESQELMHQLEQLVYSARAELRRSDEMRDELQRDNDKLKDKLREQRVSSDRDLTVTCELLRGELSIDHHLMLLTRGLGAELDKFERKFASTTKT